MALPRHMGIFYVALGVILLLGALLILRQIAGRSRPASVSETVPDEAVATEVLRQLGHSIGSDSARVEIVEFADVPCPGCQYFTVVQFPLVRDRLVAAGRLRWRFVDFPLPGHSNSPAAHLAAACADEQGRFWEMMHWIFYRQNRWASDRRPGLRMQEYADLVGLDRSRFDSCMETRRAQATVDAGRVGGERLGVDETPTFFVNGRKWPTTLDYDGIRAIVDSIAPVDAASATAATPAN